MKLFRLSFLLGLGLFCLPFLANTQISAHFTCPSGSTSQIFNYTAGGLQTFTVPVGVAELTIYGAGATGGGASAGGGAPTIGGDGGVIGAKFAVTAGETLTLLVGEHGVIGNSFGLLSRGAGGGGGTFVFKGTASLANLLLGAGGGGGAAVGKDGGDSDGILNQPGDPSSGGNAGGGAGPGAGGGGLTANGGNVGASLGGRMIIAPGNAAGGTNGDVIGIGGYGGGGSGGSAVANEGGGGGGGYMGGEGGLTLGGDASAGGFSFLDNVRGTQLTFDNDGNPSIAGVAQNGQVLICYVSPFVPDPIPTMGQWGLLIFGLLVLNLGVIFLYKKQTQLIK